MQETLVFAGGLVASAFAFARLSMGHHRASVERLAGVLEDGLRRQEAAIGRMADAVEALRQAVSRWP